MLGLLGPVAFHPQQIQYHAVMYHPVYRRQCGHGVFEDPLPFREDQIGGDEQAASFVTLGQQGK